VTTRSENEQNGVFRQTVRVDAHTFAADVSPELGGQGSAPTPHDYFDASLATCKALTALIYAKGRGIALDAVAVQVERDDSQERKGRYVLRLKVDLQGTLSDAEKAKVHDAITRCPVHKLMTATTVEIETTPL
jgi:putative redox protein